MFFSLHSLMAMWVAFTSWLLWIVLLGTWACRFLCVLPFNSIGYQPRSGIPELCHSSICNFFLFWLRLQHMEIVGPGIEPITQQWPKLLQWQCQILVIEFHIASFKKGLTLAFVLTQKFIFFLGTRSGEGTESSYGHLTPWTPGCAHALVLRFQSTLLLLV